MSTLEEEIKIFSAKHEARLNSYVSKEALRALDSTISRMHKWN